jgi:hypothetical protein
VLKFLSVKSIVIPPASTGKDKRSKKEVISIDHTNSGSRCIVIPLARILKIVVIKLIAPVIEEMPAKCKLKIAKSTAGPECEILPDSGGYNVQPVPAPPSTTLEQSNKASEGGNNQKLRLFNLGNAMSGAPIIKGTNQLPKPPISIGITIKKIMTKACAVTKTLYSWLLPPRNLLPGCANSIRIKTDINIPIIPDKPPKIKYKVPMSLWLVVQSHL